MAPSTTTGPTVRPPDDSVTFTSIPGPTILLEVVADLLGEPMPWCCTDHRGTLTGACPWCGERRLIAWDWRPWPALQGRAGFECRGCNQAGTLERLVVALERRQVAA